MIYTKIGENRYKGYDEETKMNVILSFSNGEHDEEINNFIIKTLTDLYIKRISKKQ